MQSSDTKQRGKRQAETMSGAATSAAVSSAQPASASPGSTTHNDRNSGDPGSGMGAGAAAVAPRAPVSALPRSRGTRFSPYRNMLCAACGSPDHVTSTMYSCVAHPGYVGVSARVAVPPHGTSKASGTRAARRDPAASAAAAVRAKAAQVTTAPAAAPLRSTSNSGRSHVQPAHAHTAHRSQRTQCKACGATDHSRCVKTRCPMHPAYTPATHSPRQQHGRSTGRGHKRKRSTSQSVAGTWCACVRIRHVCNVHAFGF